MPKISSLPLLILIAGLLAACSSPQVSLPVTPTPIGSSSILPFHKTPTPGGATTPLPQLDVIPPDLPRPQPVTQTFNGCPAQGDGGDPTMNLLKNRIDEATWQPATIAAVIALRWPQSIERRNRANWSTAERAEIARYEGLPLQLVGYLAGAKSQSPESCNCHSVDNPDFHLWIVDDANKGRDQSVVIEVSPRVRDRHPGWTIERLRDLVNRHVPVRISGWLMMDGEHPDQIGKTRGSIWEIHPIMQIEAAQGNAWATLDQATGPAPPPGIVPTQPGEPEPISETPEPGRVTATPYPGGIGQHSGQIEITSILADGKREGEPDEYVEIANTEAYPVDMSGWTLSDEANHVFQWDNYILAANATIRVYTNEVHQQWGGFSYGSGSPIWGNKGDIAYLEDTDGNLIATYRYGDHK